LQRDALCGIVRIMAVEVFNINYYLMEASASNPDAAVLATHNTFYALNSAPADRVFVQHSLRYLVSGGIVPALTVPTTKVAVVNGPSPSRNELTVLGTRLFKVLGGSRLPQAKVFTQETRLFAVTS